MTPFRTDAYGILRFVHFGIWMKKKFTLDTCQYIDVYCTKQSGHNYTQSHMHNHFNQINQLHMVWTEFQSFVVSYLVEDVIAVTKLASTNSSIGGPRRCEILMTLKGA